MVGTAATELLRKSAQEVEIDHLLAEEFYCDPNFGLRFLAACSLACEGFEVINVTPEPSLGEGFGDLLVEGSAQGGRVGLLIEDKITAAAATRQALRYEAYAKVLRENGWDIVWTILVGPAAYRGERGLYDASVTLEKVAELMHSCDPVRLEYRRGIIHRALQKARTTGVQLPDLRLHELKSQYLKFIAEQCAALGLAFAFPPLREGYHDRDSWITPIHHSELPAHLMLRHRLWTSIAKPLGQVDLIAVSATEVERKRFADARPVGAAFAPYSKNGVQISITLPEMRQTTGFNREIALEALRLLSGLTEWYLAETKKIGGLT